MTKSELEAKFDQFLAQNNGKPVKVLPNNLPPQCFDLCVAFTDMLGIPHVPGNPSPFPYPNASQIYTDFGTFQAQYFDRIANSDTFIPQKGDIGVYSGKLNGGIGDVFICTGTGNTKTFQGFNQNWSPKQPATLITHNYNYFLGVLRLKVTQQTQPMARTPEDAAYIAGLEKAVNTKDGQIQTLEDENLDLSRQIETERSNHKAELEAKDVACDTKIKEIQAIPPKVDEVVTEIPKQAKNQWLNGIIQFLYTLDR